MILERIYLFEELIKLVNELFRLFLNVRLGSEWQGELQKVRGWVSRATIAD
jgi:hypothetical protein